MFDCPAQSHTSRRWSRSEITAPVARLMIVRDGRQLVKRGILRTKRPHTPNRVGARLRDFEHRRVEQRRDVWFRDDFLERSASTRPD
jgi:hypothetical protein